MCSTYSITCVTAGSDTQSGRVAVQNQCALVDFPADRRDVRTRVPHDGAHCRRVRAAVREALRDRTHQYRPANARHRRHTRRTHSALPDARRPHVPPERTEPLRHHQRKQRTNLYLCKYGLLLYFVHCNRNRRTRSTRGMRALRTSSGTRPSCWCVRCSSARASCRRSDREKRSRHPALPTSAPPRKSCRRASQWSLSRSSNV